MKHHNIAWAPRPIDRDQLARQLRYSQIVSQSPASQENRVCVCVGGGGGQPLLAPMC